MSIDVTGSAKQCEGQVRFLKICVYGTSSEDIPIPNLELGPLPNQPPEIVSHYLEVQHPELATTRRESRLNRVSGWFFDIKHCLDFSFVFLAPAPA